MLPFPKTDVISREHISTASKCLSQHYGDPLWQRRFSGQGKSGLSRSRYGFANSGKSSGVPLINASFLFPAPALNLLLSVKGFFNTIILFIVDKFYR
jgi:hypothetical protein